MSTFETLPQPLFCLTLAHSIDDVDAVERYLEEYPQSAEACMHTALRTALETSELPPVPYLSSSQLLNYLTILWTPVDLQLTPLPFGLPIIVLSDKVFQAKQIDAKIVEAAKVGALYLIPYFTIQNPGATYSSYGPALTYASERGDIEMVKYLLRGPSFLAFYHGHSPIINASRNGHLDVVKLLLEKGANVHGNNEEPLIAAAKNRHLDVVKLLVEKGANIHGNYDDPLISAIQNGDLDMVRFLLESGANADSVSGMPLLHASSGGNIEIVKLLLAAGAKGDVVLSAAAQGGHLDIVRLLLDIGMKDEYALYNAAENNHPEVVQLLLTRLGNDEKMITTALVHVAHNEKAFTLLLQNGVNVNIGDGGPLIKAIQEKRTEAVKLLLEHKANPHLRHETALMDAAAEGYDTITMLLIDAGADIHVNDDVPQNGESTRPLDGALIYAAGGGHEDTVELLLERKANIHAQDDAALAAAAAGDHDGVVRLLLERGARPGSKMTPLVQHSIQTALQESE